MSTSSLGHMCTPGHPTQHLPSKLPFAYAAYRGKTCCIAPLPALIYIHIYTHMDVCMYEMYVYTYAMNMSILYEYMHSEKSPHISTHTHTHTRNEPAGCGRRWGCDCTWCRRWQLRRHALGAYRGSWQSCSSPPGAPCISSHIRTQGSRLINRRLVRACASSLQRGALARKWPVVVVACARAIARTRALCRRADRHPFFGASGAVCEAPTPCVSRTASATPRLTDTHTLGPCVGHLPPSAAVLRHVLSLLLRQVQQRHHPCGAEPTALVSDAICQRLRGCRQEARSYVAHVLSVVRMCATKPRVHF